MLRKGLYSSTSYSLLNNISRNSYHHSSTLRTKLIIHDSHDNNPINETKIGFLANEIKTYPLQSSNNGRSFTTLLHPSSNSIYKVNSLNEPPQLVRSNHDCKCYITM